MGAGESKLGGGSGVGKRVVVAVDESPVSLDTLRWAARNVLKENDELHLVTVLDTAHTQQVNIAETAPLPDESVGTCSAEPGAMEYTTKFLESIKDSVLEKEQVRVGAVKLQPLVSCVDTAHDVGRAIADYAGREKADVCVVGSKGLGYFRRMMLGSLGIGSVSQAVLRFAPCTVMIHKLPSGGGAA